MKARVKETGEIIEVREEYDLRGEMPQVFYSNEEDPYEVYEKEELDFNVNDNISPTIDYWEKRKHQYAGMVMQGLLSNPNIAYKDVKRGYVEIWDYGQDNILGEIPVSEDMYSRWYLKPSKFKPETIKALGLENLTWEDEPVEI